MTRLRLVVSVAAIGVALPYLARLPGCFVKGSAWMLQYVGSGVVAVVFLEAFNSIAVVVAMGLTAALHRRNVWVLPVAAGYSFLFIAHATLDLASDAQAPVALVFIPMYSVPFFVVGAGIALVARWVMDIEARETGSK